MGSDAAQQQLLLHCRRLLRRLLPSCAASCAASAARVAVPRDVEAPASTRTACAHAVRRGYL